MQVLSGHNELREVLDEYRRAGDHIALISTMGNLHDGHLSLMTLAREHAERVVVSIFVNPIQFAEDEDYESYPRTLERDKRYLKRVKADLLFVPDVESIYPFGTDSATSVTVPVLTEDFCSVLRPGRFDGVTSVVSRLFSIVRPDVAIFGEADFQQQFVIRRMVEDMHLPIKIVSGPTVRGDDGLALSSCNQYLTDEERAVAPMLYSSLCEIRDALQTGDDDYANLEKNATERLTASGFDVEHISIRRAENLAAPDRDSDRLVVLAAAWLGKAHLVDNIVVEI